MPKQTGLIVGGLAVLAIIAVVAFTQLGKSKQQEASQVAPQQQTQGEESMTKSSIKSLLGVGKNVTCIISYPEHGSSGTIYVSDNKMRGDFTALVNDKSMASSIIQDGTYMYMWSGNQGTKMSVEQVMTATPTPSSQSTDLDAQVDMKCSNTSPDSSKFTPPADVQFTDMSAMMDKMQSGQPGASGSPKMDASYCNQITDAAAKAACIKAAGQ